MQRPALIFEQSPLFLIVCALLGLAYAYILYKNSGPWGKRTNYVLFGLRFLLASIIASLLVSPILKQIQNTIEEPTYIIAIDNSSSIANSTDSLERVSILQKIGEVANSYRQQGFNVRFRTIDDQQFEELPTNLSFTAQQSNLAGLLENIRADYEGRNLAGVMLVSDGIYNEGIAPTYRDYKFKVATLGVGDTVPKADISINSLVYNKISYQGNKFPVLVQFTQQGYSGDRVNIAISRGGKLLASQPYTLRGENQINEVKLLIDADEKGFQRYTVNISPLEGEFTTLNNTQQAYVEIIEGKENIAIIAAAPHPDIKALRLAIESNANYSFDQYLLSLPNDRNRLINNKTQYDLIIYHQIPDRRGYDRVLAQLELDEIASLFIFGGNSDLRSFNQSNKVLTLDAVPGEYDQINAVFNQGFVNFRLSEQLQQTFTELPPISVPFGKYNLSSGSSVMLYQQVGSITTTKPLIALNEEIEPKQAVVMGDGLWKWNLTSYVMNDNHEAFNELVTKLVQFLSSKEDRRKFKAYPVKNEFNTNEKVVFDTEVYNDLYERIYGNKINFSLKDDEGNNYEYSYITNENNTRYSMSGLPQGVYKYTASTTLGDENSQVSGEFVIKAIQIEDINLTADFNILRTLSQSTVGNFYKLDDIDSEDVTQLQAQGIIHTSEKYLPFINLQWLFFVLLALVATEWFLRKYNGSY
ncbi:MAG: VWA domain-containing protein [Fulvivirga sp.]